MLCVLLESQIVVSAAKVIPIVIIKASLVRLNAVL